MFSKWDKAWVAALVGFGSYTAMQFFGLEVSEPVQAGIASLLSGALTWLVPNKPQ